MVLIMRITDFLNPTMDKKEKDSLCTLTIILKNIMG
jgi:hypothetical protein